jgi:hypothetical protein
MRLPLLSGKRPPPPATSGDPRCVVLDGKASQTCQLERMADRGIIAPRRKNSAHLRRPWRAIKIKYLQKITV